MTKHVLLCRLYLAVFRYLHANTCLRRIRNVKNLIE